MHNISKYLDYLKEIRKFQLSLKARKIRQKRPDHAKRHEQTANQVTEIIDFLEQLPTDESGQYVAQSGSGSTHDPSEAETLFSFAASDLEALPEAVRDSLNLNETDELEGKVIELIRIANRPLNVRELILGLYRKYGYEVKQRNPFASKLYRMTNSGALINVPKKRGYYDLPKTAEADSVGPVAEDDDQESLL